MELASLILIVAIATGLMGIRIINQQTAAIVETLGRYSRCLEPGLNWIFFPFQRITGTLSLRIDEVQSSVEVKTSDNMFVSLPVSLMIRVTPERASDAWYKLQNPSAQISTWVLNTIRAIAASMTLEDLFKDRDHLVTQVEKALSAKLEEFGYVLEAVLVDQPTVSSDVQASFNRVVAAKREREAAEQEAEALRIKTVRQAEAEADAQRARAKGLADSRKLLAEGLRESLADFEKFNVNSGEALTVLMETNRIDAMRDIGKHGNLVLLDVARETNNAALLGLGAKFAGPSMQNAGSREKS